MTVFRLCAVISLLFADLAQAQENDARAIIVKSLASLGQSDRVKRQYTYRKRQEDREYDSKGGLKSTRSKVFEVQYLGGEERERLIERDGKALSAGDAEREQQKFDRALASYNALSASAKAKKQAENEARQQRDIESLSGVPDAYEWKLEGETTINGRSAYKIAAEPRQDYKGKYAAILRKTHGTLYIDTADFHCARMEAEALSGISFGWFLANIAEGSRFLFEAELVNGEVWLPKTLSIKGSGRVLMKRERVEIQVDFLNYRKFRTDSRLTN